MFTHHFFQARQTSAETNSREQMHYTHSKYQYKRMYYQLAGLRIQSHTNLCWLTFLLIYNWAPDLCRNLTIWYSGESAVFLGWGRTQDCIIQTLADWGSGQACCQYHLHREIRWKPAKLGCELRGPCACWPARRVAWSSGEKQKHGSSSPNQSSTALPGKEEFTGLFRSKAPETVDGT